MVPSPTQDNPPWSPHPPLTTPYYPLTNPTQLIKFDLANFLLDKHTYIRTDRPNLRYEKNRALRALIFSAPAGRARSLRELGAFGPYGWPSATWDLPLYVLTTQDPSRDNPPWSPHSPVTTPHGPLTHP